MSVLLPESRVNFLMDIGLTGKRMGIYLVPGLRWRRESLESTVNEERIR